ncbi:PH domain-containing protein [Corynebacterium glucuronolyticum]|uniref:PH domain-containing protein n=1 Tax=Corynebacterium glucuronolyticum TaxID=39791 RepID=UPI00223C3BB4|nr:PH domain-containing protein [Corynebacterium glucuronolyticum]MCT1441446.1 PH domain-containing protein [Corynebacterium glucuronolyticum]
MFDSMNPVSRKLATSRVLSAAVWCGVFAVAGAVAGYLGWRWFYVIPAVFVLLFAYLCWLLPAQVRYLGWREAPDELEITRGKFFHTFTVVPYGRIQYVDVTQGPFQRLFGLKVVDVKTASASTDASIPGLPAAEADALRDRLAERARERMSGL